MAEDSADAEEGERDKDEDEEEKNGDDIPLDNDSVLADEKDEESFSEDAKS